MTSHVYFKPSRQRGWNLIELLVVVSIITILLAILINAAAESKGPVEQTKVILRGVMGAATEYEVATTQKVSHATNPAGLTLQNPGTPEGPPPHSIQRLCFQIWKLDKTRNAIWALGKENLQGVVGSAAPTAILDGWGRPIKYYSGADGGGGLLAPAETGMPKRRDPYVASAGPDGNWGTVNHADKNQPDAAAADNIYSFDLQ